MDWHTTGAREELLIALRGRVALEVQMSARRVRRRLVAAGACAFLPPAMRHRVLNRSTRAAHYLYVTAPTR